MSSSAARRLLEIEQVKRATSPFLQRSLPYVLGFGNLFFCAYYERFLADDGNGHALGILLATEMLAYLAVIVQHFMDEGGEILDRTRIFPLSPRARMEYVVRGNLTRPVPFGLLLSTAFFLAVFYGGRSYAIIVAPLLFICASLLLNVTSSLVLLHLSRRRHPASSAATFAILVSLCAFGSMVFFDLDVVATILPMAQVVVWGVVQATQGQAWFSLIGALILLGSSGIVLLLGRKFA